VTAFPKRIVGQRDAFEALVRDVVAKVAPDERIAAAVLAVLVVSGAGASQRFAWRLQVLQRPELLASRSSLLADVAQAARQLAAQGSDA
jgi:hypothetical protein